jgi:hypothetical protein
VAVGENEVYWRKRLVAFTVASSSAITGWAKVTHCSVVKALRHVAQGCGVANSGEPIQRGRDSSGYDDHSRIVAGVHPRGDISYPLAVIQLHRAQITMVGANPGARSPAVSSPSWRSDLDTVPSRSSFSQSDRACLGAFCSKFYVVTRSTCCIKVVA